MLGSIVRLQAKETLNLKEIQAFECRCSPVWGPQSRGALRRVSQTLRQGRYEQLKRRGGI